MSAEAREVLTSGVGLFGPYAMFGLSPEWAPDQASADSSKIYSLVPVVSGFARYALRNIRVALSITCVMRSSDGAGAA